MPTPFAIGRPYIRPGENLNVEDCTPLLCSSSSTLQKPSPPPSYSSKLPFAPQANQEIIPHRLFHKPCSTCGATHRHFLSSSASRCKAANKGTAGRLFVCKHKSLSFEEVQNIRTSFVFGRKITPEDICAEPSCQGLFRFEETPEGEYPSGLLLYQWYSVVQLPPDALAVPRIPRLAPELGNVKVCPHLRVAEMLGRWIACHGESFTHKRWDVGCPAKGCATWATFSVRERDNMLRCRVKRKLGKLEHVWRGKWTSQVYLPEKEEEDEEEVNPITDKVQV